MRIELIAQTFIMGRHALPGEVVDVPPALGLQAVGCGRAKIAAAGNETQPPPVIETEIRESSMPPRRRR